MDAGQGRRASPRSASARATRSGSRPGCRSTATSSTATTNPFEAGLGRVVKLDKPGDFVGRAALERVAARRRRAQALVGLVAARPRDRPPRLPGLLPATGATGVVTSGTQSPTLGEPIAMALRRHGRCRAGYDARRRDPRSAGPRRGRRPAVLPPGPLTGADARPASRDPHAECVRCRPCRGGVSTRWSPRTCATRRTTSGSASRATRRRSGSPTYAADQLGDIVFVELPERRARRLDPVRRLRRRRVGQGGQRPVRPADRRGHRGERRPGRVAGARQQRPVRRGLDAPRSSSPTPAEVDELLDAGGLRRADRGRLSRRMPYGPHTAGDRERMLAALGHRSRSTSCSPTSPRPSGRARLDLPEPEPELELAARLQGLAGAQPDRPRVVPRRRRLPPLHRRRRSTRSSSAASGTRPTRRTSPRSARARSRASTSTSR